MKEFSKNFPICFLFFILLVIDVALIGKEQHKGPVPMCYPCAKK